MPKYSFEFKKKIVEAYFRGEGGYTYLAEKYGVKNRRQVLNWIHYYEELGDDGLRCSREKKTYSFEFKLHVVELYLSHALISKWVNDFKIAGPDALRPRKRGRKKSMNSKKEHASETQRVDALYSSPQFHMASRMGFRLSPKSVKMYSTLGGTSAYTVRVNKPFSSIARSCAVNTFCDTLPIDFFSSPNRFVPVSKSRKIKTFHLSPIKVNVVSTGQAGNSFTVFDSLIMITSTQWFLRETLFPLYCMSLIWSMFPYEIK